jgi:metal-responsive CopG/Arc/MetJ family transcriptional regulator
MLQKTLERANISLPRRVVYRLNARAKSTRKPRSGFIARMAIDGTARAAQA